MQTQNRLLDDLAKVASGAINTLGGLREEIETRVKERVERLAAEMELVSREDLDATKTMAANARSAQEALEQRVAALETEIKDLRESKPKRPAPRTQRRKPS